MSKDIFGLTSAMFKKRLEFEKNKVEDIKRVFCETIEQIQFTAEEDGWHRVVIFSSNSLLFGNMAYTERSSVLYYLRKHPNIITKLSDKEKRANTPEVMKPYLFKWVDSAEKENLGITSNYFRNLSSEVIRDVGGRFPNKPADFFVDIFSILEFLMGKKNKTWIDISIYNISAFSGVPLENTRFALNELLKNKLIVFAYVPCAGMRGRLKLNVQVTLSEDDYNKAANGEGIDAKKIFAQKDAVEENFKFTTLDYFFDAIGEVQEENDAKRVEVAANYFNDTIHKFQVDKSSKKTFESPQIEIPLDLEPNLAEEKAVEVKQKNLPNENPQPINIIMPELPGLNQTLDDIKSCVVSFTNIAESMYKSEAQRNELLNNIVQTNVKQREEYDDLYNQMVAMKKILNQKDRDRDNFIKAIQDALNMMMGKIISETDEFSKIPRHLMDEKKLQAHKAEVIQITVQTAEEIRKLAY